MSESPPQRWEPLPEVRALIRRFRNRPIPSRSPSIAHSIVIPRATYSPWRTNQTFKDDFALVRRNSLVDVYRCFELWTLVGQAWAQPGDVLEVGVWRGGTGVLMALQAQRTSPSARVYLCDTFEGVVKAGAEDAYYKGGEHSNTSVEVVEELAKQAGVDNIDILTGVFPDDNGDALDNKRFNFCHIDVDVYDSAKAIFDWVWPRLNRKGMVVFDDYGFLYCNGVTKLGNELSIGSDRVFIHNLNGHAVIIKC